MRTLIFCLCVMALPGLAHARILELTFDDGKAGTGEATGNAALANMEASRALLGVDPAAAKLVGTAVRSALTAGRYGRAAEMPDGAGYVEIKGIPGVGQTPTVHFWVKAKSTSAGTLFNTVGVFKLVIDTGALYLDVAQAAGADKRIDLSAPFPADGAWHHVTVTLDRRGAIPKFTVSLDGNKAGETTTALVKPSADPDLRLGEGFSGWIDELLIAENLPNDNDRFDRSPTFCPSGLTCSEEVFTMTPTGFTHEVPVRYKVAYDGTQCSAASPCPLLFDVSGGNDCADDYAGIGSVARFAKAGFVVVTGDAYCEAGSTTAPHPTETSQYVAIKDRVLKSALEPLIKGTTYHASGCSHGAGMVVVWLLHATDRPARIYARSPGLDSLCVHASEVVCPTVRAETEKRITQLLGGPLDWDNPLIKQANATRAAPEFITPQLAASHEIAISWGVNLSGPICNASGGFLCNEQGQWGMNWGGRRFRDVWKAREPQSKPSGYFVEDRGADCRHCAPTNSQAFNCGLCLLKHGRAAMSAQCASCLDHSAPDIGPGGAAEKCKIVASWYTDPLGAAAGDGGNKDGGATDAKAAGGDGAQPPSDDGGCCSTSSARDVPTALLVLLLAGLALARVRRSRY